MIKFRLSEPEELNPESIVLMFRDLERDPSIKFLYSHQDKILEQYYSDHLKNKDVAIELPTGTGKTLVGLLIAEYRRRVLKEKVVFLCPTKQLCFQVAERASLYGINTSVLVGRQDAYSPSDFYKYQQGKSVAITTYSSIFNTNPRIEDPNSIICDDAHAADNYVASLWTLSIDSIKHNDLYKYLCLRIKECIPENVTFSIEINNGGKYNSTCVDLISNISLSLQNKFDEIGQIIEDSIEKYKYNDLKYPWSSIASNLKSCLFYITPEKIEIRPFIPPTQNHLPFFQAQQRIYMSATFGADGDIERLFGVKNISKIPIPDEWNQRNTGRRLILFPDISDSNDNKSIDTCVTTIKGVERTLLITTDDRTSKSWEKKLPKTHTVVRSEKIEKSMDEFTKSQKPSVLLLSRYDGIDLPGDQCRLMLIDGKPSGSGLQEKYFLTKLGASAQLKNRIRTRITQAMGRCTRDESDYSVVIIYGNDLTQWLCTTDNTKEMHPELQAEIAFGLENSTELSTNEFIEMIELFLSRSPEWKAPENDIQKRRSNCKKATNSVNTLLANSMKHEIDYTYNAWKLRHEDAFQSAIQVLSALEGGSEIQPYRAFWQHQAATSAFLAWNDSNDIAFKNSAIKYLKDASLTSRHITWLGRLISQISEIDDPVVENLPLHDCFLEINQLLSEWRIQGSKYDKEVLKVQDNLNDTGGEESDNFEHGLRLLGRMLGAQTHQWSKNESGTPDGLWVFGSWHAFVFEAKTNENPEHAISLTTLRQARTHEQRVRADKLIPSFIPCTTIIMGACDFLQRKIRIEKQ